MLGLLVRLWIALLQNFDRGDGKGAAINAVVYTYACTYTTGYTSRQDGYLAATVFDDMQTPGFSNRRFSNPTTIVPEVMDKLTATDMVSGTFEVACPDRLQKIFDTKSNRQQTTAIFSWSNPRMSNKSSRSYVFCETFSIVKNEQAGQVTTFTSTINERSSMKLSRVPFVAKLGRSNQQALYSFPDFREANNQKKLKVVTFDQTTFKLGVLEQAAEVDKTQYFSSFNGRRIYCVRTIEGETPAFDAASIEAVKNGAELSTANGPYNIQFTPKNMPASTTKVKLYQLCEARWVDEIQSYYDFYPIAQIDYVPDNIGVICATKQNTHFSMAMVKEDAQTKELVSTIYQVDVPVVLSGIALSASPVAPFAAVGDMCWYMLEVANVGNGPITSITMESYVNGKAFEKREFDKLADCLQVSTPAKVAFEGDYSEDDEYLSTETVDVDENGVAKSEKKPDPIALAGILWPGKRQTYKFGFKVPEGLKGDTTFGVKLVAVADKMDYGNFTWPEDLCVPQAQAIAGVPLFAPNNFPDENSTPLSVLDHTETVFDAKYENDRVNFEVYLEAGIESAPKTGDNNAAVIGVAAAVAAGAGAVAVSKMKQAADAETDEA